MRIPRVDGVDRHAHPGRFGLFIEHGAHALQGLVYALQINDHVVVLIDRLQPFGRVRHRLRIRHVNKYAAARVDLLPVHGVNKHKPALKRSNAGDVHMHGGWIVVPEHRDGRCARFAELDVLAVQYRAFDAPVVEIQFVQLEGERVGRIVLDRQVDIRRVVRGKTDAGGRNRNAAAREQHGFQRRVDKRGFRRGRRRRFRRRFRRCGGLRRDGGGLRGQGRFGDGGRGCAGAKGQHHQQRHSRNQGGAGGCFKGRKAAHKTLLLHSARIFFTAAAARKTAMIKFLSKHTFPGRKKSRANARGTAAMV